MFKAAIAVTAAAAMLFGGLTYYWTGPAQVSAREAVAARVQNAEYIRCLDAYDYGADAMAYCEPLRVSR